MGMNYRVRARGDAAKAGSDHSLIMGDTKTLHNANQPRTRASRGEWFDERREGRDTIDRELQSI